MKKLLILTALLMLTSGAVGCRCLDWLCCRRPAAPCPPQAVTFDGGCPPGGMPQMQMMEPIPGG